MCVPCLQAPKSPSGAELIDVQDTFITIQAEQPRVEAATKARPHPRTRPCAYPALAPTLLTLAFPLALLLAPAPASPSPYAQPARCPYSGARAFVREHCQAALQTRGRVGGTACPHPTLPPSPPSPYTPPSPSLPILTSKPKSKPSPSALNLGPHKPKASPSPRPPRCGCSRHMTRQRPMASPSSSPLSPSRWAPLWPGPPPLLLTLTLRLPSPLPLTLTPNSCFQLVLPSPAPAPGPCPKPGLCHPCHSRSRVRFSTSGLSSPRTSTRRRAHAARYAPCCTLAHSAPCCAHAALTLRPAQPPGPPPHPHPPHPYRWLPPQVLVLRDSAGRPDVLMRCSEPAAEAAPYTAEQLDDVIASEEETTVSGDAPSD